MNTYIHYIKIRESDQAIIDGFSSAFYQNQNLAEYQVFKENAERHFRQDWKDEYGQYKFKLENNEIIEREKTKIELDKIKEMEKDMELLNGDWIIEAIEEIDVNSNLSEDIKLKIARIKELKGIV